MRAIIAACILGTASAWAFLPVLPALRPASSSSPVSVRPRATGSPGSLPRFSRAGRVGQLAMTVSDEAAPAPAVVSKQAGVDGAAAIAAIKARLMQLGVVTCRGERASAQDKAELQWLVKDLTDTAEAQRLARSAEDMQTFSCEGAWDLVMSDTQLFRSSPFFMAARAVVAEGEQADQFNWFCDQHRAALDFSQIGRVRQVVANGQLRSEFEVKVGLATVALGLPVSVTGWIVTTAQILNDSTGPSAMDEEGIEWKLAIKSVQVEESNIPGLRAALDSWLQLPIQPITQALESTPVQVETWRPTPSFRTRYVDEDMRVSTDQDENVFVYIRT